MGFKDHFSGQAGAYSAYRPRYPKSLFALLASRADGHALAWDCATGNGQAALGLASHFRRVIATDASKAQIEKAQRHERIRYCVATAENAGIRSHTVDLVVVAQALHWFDFPAFFQEVERVLKPGGLLAVWTYSLMHITPEIDEVIRHFYREIVGPFWPPERKHTENGYRDIALPYNALPVPPLAMHSMWGLDAVLGYIGTWSAVQRYRMQQGTDPLAPLRLALTALWQPASTPKPVRWPLSLQMNQKSADTCDSGHERGAADSAARRP